jgi:hypothetical protein
MLNIGVLGKHDSVVVLIFCRLSRRDRVRLIYEHGSLDEIPLSALAKADGKRRQEMHVS